MDEMVTPITQDEWRSLEPGDGIKDAYGRVWEVKARIDGEPDRLIAQCPDHRPERLWWHDNGILDEEIANIIELHQPSVTIVRQS